MRDCVVLPRTLKAHVGPMAQWIRRRSSEPKIVGSSPTVVIFGLPCQETSKHSEHVSIVTLFSENGPKGIPASFAVWFTGAPIAQLGERQTEDLKVPGSIPGLGIIPRSTQFLM